VFVCEGCQGRAKIKKPFPITSKRQKGRAAPPPQSRMPSASGSLSPFTLHEYFSLYFFNFLIIPLYLLPRPFKMFSMHSANSPFVMPISCAISVAHLMWAKTAFKKMKLIFCAPLLVLFSHFFKSLQQYLSSFFNFFFIHDKPPIE
jgi:hypothetical protein